MKTKYRKNKTQFNIMVNEEEYELVKALKEKYAINLSGSFKIFLKELKAKLDKVNEEKS